MCSVYLVIRDDFSCVRRIHPLIIIFIFIFFSSIAIFRRQRGYHFLHALCAQKIRHIYYQTRNRRTEKQIHMRAFFSPLLSFLLFLDAFLRFFFGKSKRQPEIFAWLHLFSKHKKMRSYNFHTCHSTFAREKKIHTITATPFISHRAG